MLVLGACCYFLVYAAASSSFTGNEATIYSDLGGFGLLFSAPTPTDNVWPSVAVHHRQPNNPHFCLCSTTSVTSSKPATYRTPATSSCTSKRPARGFVFTSKGSAGVTGKRRGDQAVAAVTLKFEHSGPASTSSTPHIIASTCCVTPCGPINFCTLF